MIGATMVLLFVGALLGVGRAMDRLELFAKSPNRWEHENDISERSSDAKS